MLFFSDSTFAAACLGIGPTGHCVQIGIATPAPDDCPEQ